MALKWKRQHLMRRCANNELYAIGMFVIWSSLISGHRAWWLFIILTGRPDILFLRQFRTSCCALLHGLQMKGNLQCRTISKSLLYHIYTKYRMNPAHTPSRNTPSTLILKILGLRNMLVHDRPDILYSFYDRFGSTVVPFFMVYKWQGIHNAGN